MSFRTIEWRDNAVIMIDQTKLPTEARYNTYSDYTSVAEAINGRVVRGAPAIGVSAAMDNGDATAIRTQTGEQPGQGRLQQRTTGAGDGKDPGRGQASGKRIEGRGSKARIDREIPGHAQRGIEQVKGHRSRSFVRHGNKKGGSLAAPFFFSRDGHWKNRPPGGSDTFASLSPPLQRVWVLILTSTSCWPRFSVQPRLISSNADRAH